jgi:hypothetical protein
LARSGDESTGAKGIAERNPGKAARNAADGTVARSAPA